MADDSVTYEKQLKDNGFVVIPCVEPDKLVAVRDEIDHTVANFPEYKHGATEFVGGGFYAFGNPASFHNTSVRKLRQWAQSTAVSTVWRPYTRRYMEGAKLEQCIDRMMVRPAGKAPSAEAWHRDEATGLAAGDRVFGGWINLDDHNQKFHCVAGTHKGANTHGGGFAKIKKEQHASMRADCVTVQIPPGHMLIFYEHIVHEVVSTKLKRSMYRLFTGWRLTHSDHPLHPNTATGLRTMLDNQAVMQLKSGQDSRMWPVLYWTNWRGKLVAFSEGNIKDEILIHRAIKDKKSKNFGETYHIVPEVMRSLAELGLPKYPAYRAEEVAMHLPRRSWKVLAPGRTRVHINVSL
jgi:hypothetical protein